MQTDQSLSHRPLPLLLLCSPDLSDSAGAAMVASQERARAAHARRGNRHTQPRTGSRAKGKRERRGLTQREGQQHGERGEQGAELHSGVHTMDSDAHRFAPLHCPSCTRSASFLLSFHRLSCVSARHCCHTVLTLPLPPSAAFFQLPMTSTAPATAAAPPATAKAEAKAEAPLDLKCQGQTGS